MGLTTKELDSMKEAIEELLPDTANILSNSQSDDGEGGKANSWGTATLNIPCRLDTRKAASEVFTATRLTSKAEWVFTFESTASIGLADRIEHNSNTYAVEFVREDNSWNASIRVGAMKVTSL